MIKVGLVDDHELFRKALADQLMREFDVEVIMQAADGEQFLEYLEVIQPDIVLMDLDMPRMNGLEATREARERGFDNLKIIVLTMVKNRNMVLRMLDAGANGYVLKDCNITEVLESLRAVKSKDFHYNERVADILYHKYKKSRNKLDPDMNPFFDLTKNEVQVIRLVAEECTNKEIADKLDLSVRSVESYRHRIMEKIGCKNAIGIVKFAIVNDIVEI